MLQLARAAAMSTAQGASEYEAIIEAAKPWLSFTDDQLWEMMFGPTIKRSWMVWSDGYCPACHKDVPMYNWIMEPLLHPWKVRCPHCRELFPKNDFALFYESGMDDHFVFDPAKADRSLLYNAEHPDPKDPLHTFGVDDGEGWQNNGHRWRFIGAYLIYGLWKGLICNGITYLSEAYVVSGDTAYSRRAGILLDRVADLYPTHDFGKQGLVYERAPMAGYVSTWHDACIETRQMAIAFDMVREAIARDNVLALFLDIKAKSYGIAAPKTTPADIIRNIETGILRHPIQNRDRIYSNYPQTDMTIAILKSVLNKPGDREAATAILDTVLDRSTAVDGLTGEKGLTGYTVYATARIAEVLALYSRINPMILKELIQKHPRLDDMFLFHTDVWYNYRYYPHIGDCSGFALPDTTYAAISFSRTSGLVPSMYGFLWQLYEATGNPEFVRIIYHQNGNKTDGLPFDIFATPDDCFGEKVLRVIKDQGAVPKIKSVDKKAWHLAMLKGGSGDRQRAVWLDYDSGGYHAHADGLNIGIFAFGIDLMPDFGYPPVQFGGWGSEKARWYTKTAAHNTVVVDGSDQINLAGPYGERSGFEGLPSGTTTLWSDGELLKAVHVSAPSVYRLKRYQRTVAMAEVSGDDFYVFDLFSVFGGNDHARMSYSSFGNMNTFGLAALPSEKYGYNTMLENFRTDNHPRQGWSVDWKIDDRYKMLPPGIDVHLRLTDLTEGASVSLAEAWITTGTTDTTGEWIPAVVTRKHAGEAPLASNYISIIQPYIGIPFIKSIRRFQTADNIIAVEVILTDSRRDIWITSEDGNQMISIETEKGKKYGFRGKLALLRQNMSGVLTDIALVNSDFLTADDWILDLLPGGGNVEIHLNSGRALLGYGNKESVINLTYKGKPVKLLIND